MRRTVRSAARERDWAMVAGSYAMHLYNSDRVKSTGPPIRSARRGAIKFARICAAWHYWGQHLCEGEAFLDKPCTPKGLLQAVSLVRSTFSSAGDVAP